MLGIRGEKTCQRDLVILLPRSQILDPDPRSLDPRRAVEPYLRQVLHAGEGAYHPTTSSECECHYEGRTAGLHPKGKSDDFGRSPHLTTHHRSPLIARR